MFKLSVLSIIVLPALLANDPPPPNCGFTVDFTANPILSALSIPCLALIGLLLMAGTALIGYKSFFGKESPAQAPDTAAVIGKAIPLALGFLFGVVILTQPFGNFYGVVFILRLINWIASLSGGMPLCG